MKLIGLAWSHLKIGISQELHYRVNFFIQVLQSFISLVTGLVSLALVFNYTSELGGWTKPELLAIMGVYTLMGGLIKSAILPNMLRLLDDIREGTLDFALVKPVDSQTLVSVREFRFWQLTDVIMGLAVIGVAISQMQLRTGIWQTLGFIVALGLGGIIIYCFWLMLSSISFWVVRVDAMADLFQGVYAAGRWPVGIYPDWLRFGLTFLVPVAFAVTVPAEALANRLSPLSLLGEAGLTVLFMTLARLMWRLGIRSYSGASA